jgi:AraC family transcriptional regulator
LLIPQNSRTDPLAVALARKPAPDAPGGFIDRPVAAGPGWRVMDIVCTCGPYDRPYEERHAGASVSIVLAGSFVYRDNHGAALMAPGAMLLGDPDRSFECSHDHGAGDRCLSFQFDPDCFARLAEDAGARRPVFGRSGLPPLRPLAAAALHARLALENESPAAAFEEIALELAGGALRLASDLSAKSRADVADRDFSRVTRVIREIESDPAAPRTLAAMAEAAGTSRYHFLRVFSRVTGATPHQWILRARMREAARRLAATHVPVTDIALDAGFDDLSNFIRTFRAEFGVSPRAWRKNS